MPNFAQHPLARAIAMGWLYAFVVVALSVFFGNLLSPVLAGATVVESFTSLLATTLRDLLPYIAIIGSTLSVRGAAPFPRNILLSISAALVVFATVQIGFALTTHGPFAPRPSLQMELRQTETGILIESMVAAGAAAQAELQVGDLITAIRRQPINLNELNQRVAQAAAGDPFRLRFLRDSSGGAKEELQKTVRIALQTTPDTAAIERAAFTISVLALLLPFWPTSWSPYLALIALFSPLLVGYAWVILASFSTRTQGILPVTGDGHFGGFTLNNWDYLWTSNISGFQFDLGNILLNSLVVAIAMTVTVLFVASMAGYALSRMKFPGRKGFLALSLILHGFPAVTLLIPIFFVLRNLSHLPLLGEIIGFNKLGGIALVMVAFELPLGIWLMKGFFDNIPWDMERSALIDGASRFRAYWQILLPQIRPGMLALGIFAFISGWNAYLIPATYSTGAGTNTLPVLLNSLLSETAPVNWNQVAAVGLLQLFPIFIFFIFAQEYLLNIYAGGTKGSS